jgi:hypothetical protein
VKRAALLILVVGAPFAFLLFPELRRRVVHKLRFLLLLWSGAVLFFGLFGGPGKKNFFESESGSPAAWALLGLALFAAAFVSVLRDFRRSSSKNGGPGPTPG